MDDEEKKDEEQEEEFIDEREEVLKQITEGRDAELKEEGLEIDDTPAEGEPEDQESEGDDPDDAGDLEDNADEEEEEATPEGDEEEDEEPLYKIIVNGEEQEVPLSKLTEMAQKGAGADAKFAEAAEERKKTETLAAAIVQRQGAQPPPKGEAQPPSGDMKALAEKLYSGDVDQVAEALQEVSNGASQQARMSSKQEWARAELEKGFVKFQSEYPEIKQGTTEWALADTITRQLVEEAKANPGTYSSYEQVMMEAGKRTREIFTKDDKKSVDKEARTEKKRAAAKAKTPTVGARTAKKKPKDEAVLPSEQVYSNAIKDMAKARGQVIADD